MTEKTSQSLAAVLEREHREIDDGIERFRRSSQDPAPLRAAIAALRRHIYLEEEILFPALRTAGGDGLVAPIFVMLREHGQLWQLLAELERDLDAGTSDGLLQLCHQLLVALAHHNMKEERILYPQADDALSPPAAERLAAFLESGRMPDGWVCAKAGSPR